MTARQGASGLGLDAQRAAIERFAAQRGAEITGRFTGVGSGGSADRPELEKALQLARLTGATPVIAKLDRLSRNAAFLLTLRDSGVRFLACDMPEANDLTVGIMALVAPAGARGHLQAHEGVAGGGEGPRCEARQSERSRSAQAGGRAALRATVTHNADAFAGDLALVLDAIRAAGQTSLRAITAELNARGIRTRRGGPWHVSTVMNLVRQFEQVRERT